jgi:hypothetical protein
MIRDFYAKTHTLQPPVTFEPGGSINHVTGTMGEEHLPVDKISIVRPYMLGIRREPQGNDCRWPHLDHCPEGHRQQSFRSLTPQVSTAQTLGVLGTGFWIESATSTVATSCSESIKIEASVAGQATATICWMCDFPQRRRIAALVVT